MTTSLTFSSENIIKLPSATWTEEEANQFAAIEREFLKLNHKYGNMLPFAEKKSPLSNVDKVYHESLETQLVTLVGSITSRIELEDSTHRLQVLSIKEKK